LDITKNTTTGNNELKIEISSNGIEWSELSYSRATGTGTANWTLINPTGHIPSTSNLRIKFTQTSTTTQFRIDDLKLEGTPSCTSPTHSFASPTVNKLTTDAPFTNAFSSNNNSAKVWSSTNTAVATVDANSGEVSIVGAGNTNILLTQEFDGIYCGITESYILTVSTPILPEPSAHVTDFEAVANSQNAIIVTWTDASDTDGYLIKASTTSFEAINAPIDGTPEINGSLVKNVAQGDKIVEFTTLTAGTTYFFKIWAYTNSGANIGYKNRW
jgi:hypothetical protein